MQSTVLYATIEIAIFYEIGTGWLSRSLISVILRCKTSQTMLH